MLAEAQNSIVFSSDTTTIRFIYHHTHSILHIVLILLILLKLCTSARSLTTLSACKYPCLSFTSATLFLCASVLKFSNQILPLSIHHYYLVSNHLQPQNNHFKMHEIFMRVDVKVVVMWLYVVGV